MSATDHTRYDQATAAFEAKDYPRAATLLEPLHTADEANAEVALLLARTLQRDGRAAEGAPYLKLAEAMGLDA